MHRSVCWLVASFAFSGFTNRTVAAPARNPAVMSSKLSPTMINRAPPSSRFHDLAMCRIPAGSGFGGRNSRVMIGLKCAVGRKVVRRCSTGALKGLGKYGSLIGKVRGDQELSYSKFLVQIAFFTFLDSRYAIKATKPGWAFWLTIACRSIDLMIS